MLAILCHSRRSAFFLRSVFFPLYLVKDGQVLWLRVISGNSRLSESLVRLTTSCFLPSRLGAKDRRDRGSSPRQTPSGTEPVLGPHQRTEPALAGWQEGPLLHFVDVETLNLIASSPDALCSPRIQVYQKVSWGTQPARDFRDPKGSLGWQGLLWESHGVLLSSFCLPLSRVGVSVCLFVFKVQFCMGLGGHGSFLTSQR